MQHYNILLAQFGDGAKAGGNPAEPARRQPPSARSRFGGANPQLAQETTRGAALRP